MYRKPLCIVNKHRFYKEKLKFYNRTQEVLEENSIMYRKPLCIVKNTGFTMKD